MYKIILEDNSAVWFNESIIMKIIPIFLIYVLIFEIILLLIARNIVNLRFFNTYLWLQFLSGILKKAGILSLGLIGGVCTQTLTVGGVVIGIITLIAILFD
jgi:hypothetical protein